MGELSTALIGSFMITLQSGDDLKMAEKQSCLDCLHCKVSAKSTEKCRLCFCSEKKKKQNHRIAFWVSRKVCNKFEDMSV